jgi:hypothetical protein
MRILTVTTNETYIILAEMYIQDMSSSAQIQELLVTMDPMESHGG